MEPDNGERKKHHLLMFEDDTLTGDLAVAEAIDAIVDAGAAGLYENYLKKNEVPYAASRCLEEALRVVAWAYLRRDEGPNADAGEGGPRATSDVGSAGGGAALDGGAGAAGAKAVPAAAAPPAPVPRHHGNVAVRPPPQLWVADAEPIPPPIDAWAPQAIPLRAPHRPATRDADLRELEGEGGETKRSAAPSEGGGTGRSGRRRGGGKRRGQEAGAKSSAKTKGAGKEPPKAGGKKKKGGKAGSDMDAGDLPPGTIIPLAVDSASAGSGGAGGAPGGGGGGMGGDEDANLTPRSRARIEAIRAIEQKEKAEEDRRLALIREEEEQREKIEKLAKELKGKDYTFDEKGNVILIQPPNPDKLPALVTSMGIAVHSLEGESMPGRTGPKKGGGKKGDPSKGPGDETKKKKGKRGRKKKSEGPGEFYRDAVSFQQSILQNPTLALAEGVTIHEGDSSKAGPRRQDDPTRMSRKDFMLHQSMLESKSISLSPTGADAGGGMEGLLAGAAPVAAAAAGSQGNAPKAPSRPESEHAPGTAGSSAASGLEADPMDGGSPKIGSGSRGASSRRRGKGARSPGGPVADGEEKRAASPVEDPNIALINDPTWGTNVSSGKEWNPPPVPNKADERQQKETFREGLIKHPRDRPFIETSPRKRLPAPLYPANTGIGGMGTMNNSDALLPPIPGAAAAPDALEGATVSSPASPKKTPFPRDFDVTSSPDIVTIANERTKKRFFGK